MGDRIEEESGQAIKKSRSVHVCVSLYVCAHAHVCVSACACMCVCVCLSVCQPGFSVNMLQVNFSCPNHSCAGSDYQF